MVHSQSLCMDFLQDFGKIIAATSMIPAFDKNGVDINLWQLNLAQPIILKSYGYFHPKKKINFRILYV